MSTFIFVLIAVTIGLMGFVYLQGEVPDELSFLRNDDPVVADAAQPVPTTGVLDGWTIVQDGNVMEATHPFEGELNVGGTHYDVPSLGVMCNKGELFVRVETRMPTTGVKTTPVTSAGRELDWPKGTGNNVFPPDARRFVASLNGAHAAPITISFRDLGKQEVVVDVSKLPAVLKTFPAGCR